MPKFKPTASQLYYEQHGWDKDAEVVVLSNGVLMSTASWAMQVPVLAKHYRVLVYDCRGMWQSDHPAGPYSMEQHADDLAALLDALHIETGAHRGHFVWRRDQFDLRLQVSTAYAQRHCVIGGEPGRSVVARHHR